MKLNIDKSSVIPVYYQIAQQLRQYIDDNKLKDGDLIPPEREICDESGVSRMTVRQAIDLLVEEKILERQRGKGTFVTSPKFSQTLSALTSFTMDTMTRGMTPTSKVISCKIEQATPSIAKKLNLKLNSKVIRLARIRYADGNPNAYECSYLNYNKAKNILDIDLTNQSLYQALRRECGLDLVKAREMIEAGICSVEVAEHLEIPVGSVTFQIRRITSDENDKPIEYVKSNYRIDKFRFEVELDLTTN